MTREPIKSYMQTIYYGIIPLKNFYYILLYLVLFTYEAEAGFSIV